MTTFPVLDEALMRQRLTPPTGPVDMVLDTDTFNEIDDQFAVAYALLSPPLNVEAIYAAPYYNARSTGPGDGMEKSYDEILRLLALLGRPASLAYRGSDRFLSADDDPVVSPAAEDLIARARMERDGPLYVAVIGAPTNISSALLLAPDLVERIVVVWLGGHPPYAPPNNEFNLRQDVRSSQLLFESGVPFVQIPCRLVSEQLRTTLPEMATYVKGQGALGDFLYQRYEEYFDDHYARSKVIWDISAIAYLLNGDWLPGGMIPAPRLSDDRTYVMAPTGSHLMRIINYVNRDAIYGDLFRKLAEAAKAQS